MRNREQVTRVSLYAAASLVAAAALVSSAKSTEAAVSVAGVSALSYAPKPFYDDLTHMTVRFTTTGRTRPGREYFVVLEVFGRDQDCQFATVYPDDYNKPRVLGGQGKNYVVTLGAKKSSFGLYEYFCRGPARLRVGSNLIRSPTRRTVRFHRTINFRIFHAP